MAVAIGEVSRMLTTKEVARILEVSECTVRRLGDRDILPYTVVNRAGARRYDPEEVNACKAHLNSSGEDRILSHVG